MKAVRIRLIAQLIALGLAVSSPVALAQTASSGSTSTSTAPATASQPDGKLVSQFSDLAGSEENSAALVTGLRKGTDITLTEQTTQGGTLTTTSTTFSPGTKPMGYGNVRIALSLARAQLASQGITNPTTAQLQGALVGTTNTDGTMTQGILQMRASGMGWGKIANTMGFKLGAVMSGKMTYAQATATTTGSSTTSTATSATTASAASHGVGKGIVTGSGGSSSYRGNSGITTAAGGGGNGHLATGLGMGGGQGNGAVNAAGSRAGGNSGASHAGGQGKGKS